MKSIRIVAMVVVAAIAVLLSGCVVTQLKADVTPGTKLSEVKKLYVVKLPADQRGVDRMIADRLNVMGMKATNGEKSAMPDDVDAIVTYQDKWMWDITMYMLELNVQLRQPKTDMALASGHTLRTSLARKTPPELIQEVLDEIFKNK